MGQRTFTLLVVVMIVAVLPLLLPGIATVRDSVRSMVCLSPLRQVGFAHAACADDHRGLISPVETWKQWGADLLPYIDDDSRVPCADTNNPIGTRIIRTVGLLAPQADRAIDDPATRTA